jgi:uroporphyrinogen decarboxylase
MAQTMAKVIINPRLLVALSGRNDNRPPVWIMRQAGRYMPEYRALREKHSFLDLCHRPELAAEVTLLPIRKFGFDAAILFSDILIISEALGVKVKFEDGFGPIIDQPITNENEVDQLQIRPVKESLGFVADAIRMAKTQLDVPLIGFCGAPFTVASYFVEGKTSRDLKKTKQWIYKNPLGFQKLLDKLTTCTIDYLKMQIQSGVNVIQIFDTWSSLLSYESYREFAWKPLQKVMEVIRPMGVPIILFSLGSANLVSSLVELNPHGISVDWSSHLLTMRKRIPFNISVQGNMDPHVLYAPLPVVQFETKKILNAMRQDPSYIFNLGHGILPDTPVDAVKTLMQTIREHV